MKRKTLALLIATPLILIGLATGGLYWATSVFDPCRIAGTENYVSPDGRWAAVVYLRDCGATTRISSNVSLLPVGEEPEGAGNVFAAYQTEIAVVWEEDDANTLRLRYRPGVEVFRREARHEDIAIRYDESDPSQPVLSRR